MQKILAFSWRLLRAMMIIIAAVIGFVVIGSFLAFFWPLTVAIFLGAPKQCFEILAILGTVRVW